MFKKGFISAYFIYYAIIIFSLITIVFINQRKYAIARYNIQQTDKYLGVENHIIRTIQMYLEKEIDLDNLQFSEISCNLNKTDTQLFIEVYQPIQESMIVYLHNNKVYDYDTIRNETAFRE